MEPLNLTVRPPRGPRETLAGCCFLARTIDKVRAELPGGNPGAYVVTGPRSISGYVLYKLRIDVDELRAAVRRAADDDDVERWLRARIDPATVDEINAKLAASRIDTLPLADREFIAARHPVMKTRGDLTTTFALLEADDAAAFGGLPEPPQP